MIFLKNGRYVWICELKKSEKGDMASLVRKAHDLGLAGYILKAHDGSSFWQQAYAMQELKNAGISCGAWGSCYGKNVSGEIAVIERVAALDPDFYVMDVQADFDTPAMRNTAEHLFGALRNINVPLGYTSFAIPSLHTIPFDIFSNCCSFAMPQIYWALMQWDVMKAFNTSMSEYSALGLPVYPIGQITSDVSAEDIQEFNSLCSSENIPVVSYWDYQEAGSIQLDAIKQVAF